MLTTRFKVTIILALAVICVGLMCATQLLQQNQINELRATQINQINVENALQRDVRLLAPTATPSPTLKVLKVVKPLQSATSSAK